MQATCEPQTANNWRELGDPHELARPVIITFNDGTRMLSKRADVRTISKVGDVVFSSPRDILFLIGAPLGNAEPVAGPLGLLRWMVPVECVTAIEAGPEFEQAHGAIPTQIIYPATGTVGRMGVDDICAALEPMPSGAGASLGGVAPGGDETEVSNG